MLLLSSQFISLFIFELLLIIFAAILLGLLKRSNILYEQTKKVNAQRNILNNLRKNFNIQEIKRTAIQNIAEELGADRCFIAEYNEKTERFSSVKEEYLSSKNISSLKGELSKMVANRVTKICIAGQIFKIPDTEKNLRETNLKNTPIDEFYNHYQVKSSYLVPLKYSGTIVGLLAIHFTKQKRNLNNVEMKFIEEITNSIAIAIHQSELYIAQKKIADRETLLRMITQTIRSSFSYEQIKLNIVNSIGKILKTNRCFIVDFDKDKNIFLPISTEFLTSPNLKSYIGYNIEKGLPEFAQKGRNKQTIIINDVSQAIKENLRQGSYIEKHLNEFSVKALFAIPITYYDDLLGLLILQITDNSEGINEDTIDFVKSVADQTGVALYQSILYKKEKQSAEKEKLLRYFVTTIRESLDIEEIKNKIVMETGKLLKADRVFIVEIDEETDKYAPVTPKAEYLSDPGLKSLVGLDLSVMETSNIIQSARKLKLDLIHPDLNAFLDTKKPTNTKIKAFIDSFGIKASIILNIVHADKNLGALVVHYNQKKEAFSEDELEYLQTIANQIAIAIHQSILFKDAKQNADKESTLRQIISDIKVSDSIENAYKKLLEEIAQIYNLNRVLFLESSPQNHNELFIKTEYIKNCNSHCHEHLIFPQVCINDFLNMINNFDTLIINDVLNCYPDDKTLNFFKKYKIQSLMAVPLVKRNRHITVFGFIILCGEQARAWSSYEIKLLEAISESVISVLWEITKFNEVEELRNSFILTLAHDFQVPLIGERNALEYLVQYDSDKIGADAPLLNEILENNKNIIALLNRSVDIYNYEAGKKDLNFNIYNLRLIIKIAIEYLKTMAEQKNIKFNIEESKTPILVYIDKDEIFKVFQTVIENAIEKSPIASEILIKITRIENQIEIAIKDNGPGIPEEIQEKLFKRYEMALAIERKIGAGTGLFLAKNILEAHHGSIYFETRLGKGTIFYITLPLSEKAPEI